MGKRILSIVLGIFMLAGMLALPVFAANETSYEINENYGLGDWSGSYSYVYNKRLFFSDQAITGSGMLNVTRIDADTGIWYGTMTYEIKADGVVGTAINLLLDGKNGKISGTEDISIWVDSSTGVVTKIARVGEDENLLEEIRDYGTLNMTLNCAAHSVHVEGTLSYEADSIIDINISAPIDMYVTKATAPAGHYALRHYGVNAPDLETEGNLEYWCCEMCGKYFLNAAGTHETTADAVVLEALHRGDLNGDAAIGKEDLEILARYIAHMEDITDANVLLRADMDADGNVTAVDLTALARTVK